VSALKVLVVARVEPEDPTPAKELMKPKREPEDLAWSVALMLSKEDSTSSLVQKLPKQE